MKTLNHTVQYSDVLEYKKRRIARRVLQNAIKEDKIHAANCCEVCGKKAKTFGHHTDYGQPLKITWVCHGCHYEVHKANHPLNPDNVPQTHVDLSIHESDKILVSFSLPIENFILIKRIAAKKGVAFSKVLRDSVLKDHPVQNAKSVFNQRRNKENKDELEQSVSERVQVLEYDEKRVHKQKPQKVFSVRTKGSNVVQRVELFSNVSTRHGPNAAGMRWTLVKR